MSSTKLTKQLFPDECFVLLHFLRSRLRRPDLRWWAWPRGRWCRCSAVRSTCAALWSSLWSILSYRTGSLASGSQWRHPWKDLRRRGGHHIRSSGDQTIIHIIYNAFNQENLTEIKQSTVHEYPGRVIQTHVWQTTINKIQQIIFNW